MRTALHLLLMICVLWCAVGVAEPAAARAPTDRAHVTASTMLADQTPDGDTADTDGQAHHHHCPVAPDVSPGPAAEPFAHSANTPKLSPVVPLASLSRAPPLPPPSAA